MAICQNQDLIKQCEIYNFFEPCVNELVFRNIQNNLDQYIQQEYISNQITTAEYPTFYREIQYLEFLKSWNGNQIGKLVEPIKQTQDIEQIRTYLSRFGEFRFEQTDNSLRILGYS